MLLNRLQFGLPADPWAGLGLETANGARVRSVVDAAIASRALVSIVGPRGIGKTHAWRAALRRRDNVAVIEPLRLDRERLHIGDIATAVVCALSDERPRHGGEARSGQVRRLLGTASTHREIALVIDDAHVLHAATLRALKRLRELSWRGRSPLLAVVLLGQMDRAGAIPEVGLRTSTVTLAGLTAAEAEAALDACAGRALAAGVAARLAASPRARTWLDLQRLLDDSLAEAIARGDRAVTPEVAAAVLETAPVATHAGVARVRRPAGASPRPPPTTCSAAAASPDAHARTDRPPHHPRPGPRHPCRHRTPGDRRRGLPRAAAGGLGRDDVKGADQAPGVAAPPRAAGADAGAGADGASAAAAPFPAARRPRGAAHGVSRAAHAH